jgi:predicted KAP-like P-loop ATPase
MAKKKQAEQHALLADVPISTPKHDALGRSPFAKSLARTIRSMKGEDSFVFALCGRWGSGKSSVLRMVVHELEKGRSATKPEIVSFNPWWFSGQDQLLQGFLSQLSAVLGRNDTGKRTTKLGERIGTLGKVLRPFGWIPGTGNIVKDVAEILEKAGEATTGLGQQLTADVQQVRAEIDDLLRSRNRRIVVVMDDIDRLTASEITQLFLIVKAVADFPNTVYLLAFDPEVVCKAIGEKLGLDGASYLEKIVQVQVDLPSAGPIPLHQMFFSQLGLLLDEKVTTRTAQYDFADLFHDGVKEFLQTPRAVKRIINVLRALYPAVEGEVYWPDFVAVIALMVFVPAVFRLVRDNPERFAGQEHWEARERDQESAFHQEWRDQIAKNFKEPVAEIMCR